ncbi:MAG: cyclic nucleotide-binding domain-containing protein [Spirochaetales bacterium]|jgi:anti-sigma regulatory factor (Ser/Thr protein kinase)|nr:cyclic nucleotide-binding domain-containing protein [Spirochaetales bacterium]
MAFLGIINSDPEIKKLTEMAFSKTPVSAYDEIRFFSNEDEIQEFLIYDLPEIVVINFSDPSVNLDRIVSLIKGDHSFLNFGIVGLFRHEQANEETILGKYKDLNVLTLLDNNRLRTHLPKNIQIIEENYQIIFQREFTKNLMDGGSGSFIIDNDLLAVPLFAGIGATIMAQRGLINPDNKMHLQLALGELIINAVEHGNCGISYDEKTASMENGFSVVDLVAEKCKNPDIAKKKVEFLWEIRNDKTLFTIRDEGNGFDVKAHLRKIAQQSDMSLHGRGIRMATMLSQELHYNAKGNQVTLVINHDSQIEGAVPEGFSQATTLNVKPGDIVFTENEPSDFLYYIVSGKFTVYHNEKPVGFLTPRDIFMGELAFLLNKKRTATVKADSRGKLIMVDRKSFVNVIRNYPHYGIFLSKLLAKRLIRSNAFNASK